jgi:hypothetical protein
MHATSQSIEEGSTGLNAADQEVADRRERDQNEYIRERDDVLVNNLPPGRLKALEKHIALMHQLDDALIGKPSCFSEFNPELKKAIKRKNKYGELLQAETDFYRRSWKTQGWNLVAGGNGFLLCFGVGTVLSNALGMPWLALVISPVIWSLTERLIPMIRAMSWRNKHADVDYPHIMRISGQKIRDQVRQLFNLNPKKYMVNGQVLTAAQYREILSLFNAWKGKVKTDDLPYFSYSFWYSVRTVILNLCTSPAFLKTPGGVAASLVSLAVAGIFAGASTSVIAQACRRHAYKKENPDNWRRGEFLVKSPNVWKAEKNLLKAKFALMDAYLKKHSDKKTRKSFKFSQAILSMEMLKVGMKSERLTSIAYEISRLAQEESAFGEDGFSDVAGNRIDALCGLMGKAACLVPAILFNQLVAMKYTSAGFGVVTGISVTLALNIVLIMGFSFRKELEFPGRYMIEFVYACVDALNDAHGEADKYANNGTPALGGSVIPPSEGEVDSLGEDVGDSDDVTSANDNPVLPRRLNPANQTNPDGASEKDEESSDGD